MKTRFFLVFLLLMALNLVLFGRSAELDIRMFDNEKMVIVLDNFTFDEDRGRYHISNLSHGYHDLEVYRLMHNGLNPNASASFNLFYKGRIFLQEGYLTYAEVDRGAKVIILKRVKLNNSPHGYGNNGNHYGNNGNNGNHYGHYGNNGNHYGHNGNNSHYGGSYGYGAPSYSYGMDPIAFNELKHTISRTSFDSNRLDIAKFAVTGNRMTSMQVAEITSLLTFESTKLDFAKYAYRFVVDPGSYFMVANAFTFSSSKRELFDFIGYGSGY